MDLKQLITTAKNEGATEIHLKAGSAPIIRQRKFLKKMSTPAVQAADLDGLIAGLSPDDQKKFKENNVFEGNFWGAEPCAYGLYLYKAQALTTALIRLLPGSVPTFESIRLPPILSVMLEAKTGLFILSGPPRSGVSTSLAAIVEKINQTRSAHILVIQDQIDFFFKSKKSRISQRQLKKDLVSIEAGINFAKRMDVDILVIGDLRKELPFRSIIDYVNGGHCVYLTMQTLGIQTTLEKILNHFPESDMDYASDVLGHGLIGVCSQAMLVNPLEQKTVAAHEVLVVNSTIRKLIQAGKASQVENNFKSAGEGSYLFDADVPRIVKEGKISKDIGDGFLSWYRGLKG